MRPGEVLDARNDFQHRLSDPLFCKVQEAFGSMEWGRSGGWTSKHDGAEVTILMRNLLRVADVYKVSHDMSKLVEFSSLTLSPEDTFDWALAPTRNGFVSFDRPLTVLDQRGWKMLVHFLMWGAVDTGTGVPSTIVWTFNDTYREPDEVSVQLEQDMKGERGQEGVDIYHQALGRWASVSSHVFLNGQPMGPELVPIDSEALDRLRAEGVEPVPGTNVLRYLHALWLMMGQTIARVESTQAERPARRRSAKMNLPSAVTVVKLRREGAPVAEEKPRGESQIEWSHRWVVKGHWRWQVCGEGHPLAQEQSPGVYRARMWINPFVKGPEDKPFVQSEKVYSLQR